MERLDLLTEYFITYVNNFFFSKPSNNYDYMNCFFNNYMNLLVVVSSVSPQFTSA